MNLQSFLKKERNFIALVVGYLGLVLLFSSNQIALAWLACSLALYSVIANDSIQTIGTFLYSNEQSKKVVIWAFLSTIFVATVFYGWHSSGGYLDFGRLKKIPEPTEITFIQLMAPLLLFCLTRFRIPVSTTFLILCLFSSSKTIQSMLLKSGTGYFVSFLTALALTLVLLKSRQISPSSSNKWRAAQLLTTGFLWYTWLTHDVANIVVFLPRELPIESAIAISLMGTIGLAMLVWLNGGRIQEIVRTKSNISDYKSATIVDFMLTCILYYFKELNSLPMSTTFVFLGVLGGREAAMSLADKKIKACVPVIAKDFGLGVTGILLSLALAGSAASFGS